MQLAACAVPDRQPACKNKKAKLFSLCLHIPYSAGLEDRNLQRLKICGRSQCKLANSNKHDVQHFKAKKVSALRSCVIINVRNESVLAREKMSLNRKCRFFHVHAAVVSQ